MSDTPSILIVDDEVIISSFLQQVLESRGYAVIGISASGEEALRIIERKRPDLVLMDIILAGTMDGIETAGIIRNKYDIPVVYLTGNPEEQYLARVKITEPFGYIIKPANGGEVHTAVAIALYRHKMEQKLRQSEGRFRTVVESATDGICVVKEGILKYINPALRKITGFGQPLDETEERPFYQYVHPEERERVAEMYRRFVEGIDREQRYETALLRNDGGRIEVELKLSWMEEYEGSRAALIFIRDITEQKTAQEALARSEERFRSYFELPLVGFAILSPEGRWTQVNEKLCEMTGFSRDEMEGMTWQEMTPAEDLDDELNRYRIALKEGASAVTQEKRYRRKDGKLIDVMISTFCVRKHDGSPDYFVAVIQDITERKGITDLLLESEERFRVISENSPILIVITRFDGVVLYANRQAEILFNEERENIIGKISTAAFYRNPADREVIIKQLLEKGRVDGVEVALSRRDGSVLHGLVYAQVINYEKKKVILAAFDDISDLLAVQRDLRFTRFAVDRVGDAAFWMKADGTIFYVNDAACRLLNYEPEELMGKHFWEVDHFVTRERWPEEWDILKKKGASTQLSEHRTREGHRVPVEVNSNFLAYEDGEYIIAFSRDISERLRIEEALWESRTRLYEIIHFLPVATFAIDRDGCVIAWNRAMEQLCGYREADMLGKGNYEYAIPFYGERRPIMIDLIYAEEKELTEHYHMVSREGDSIFGEAEVSMPGGKTLYLWGKASPLYDTKGEVVGAIESIRDISDYKRAETALRTSEERYRAMTEAMPDSVTVVDMQYRIIYASPRSVSLHGFTSMEEMVGLNALDLIPEGEKEKILSLIPDFTAQGIVHDIEFPIMRRDGGVFHGELSAAQIHDDRGNPDSWVIITKDITERKKAEEQIRLSEEKFSKAFMLSPLVILLFDLAEGRFMEVNDRFIEASGYSRDDVIGRTPLELDMFPVEEQRERLFQAVAEQSRVRDFEIAVRNRDGSMRQTLLSGDVIPIGDKPRFIAIMIDITEMKEMQKEIATAIEQERQRIGRDLHDDLGQTLTGVTFLLQSLKHDLEGKSDVLMEEVVKIDELVRNAVVKTRSISRMLSPVEMGERGLSSALAEMTAQIEKIFVIVCQFHGEEDITVKDVVTATNLYYIAREAVTNALKHSNANRIDVFLRREKDVLLLEVQDDGTGVREGRYGSGLGLRIMQYRAGIIGAQVEFIKGEDAGFSVVVRKKNAEKEEGLDRAAPS